MQRTRRLSLASTAVLLVAFTSGCLMPRKPPPPPFRVEPYGAGFEPGSNGKLVTVSDDEGASIGRMRVSRNSLRVQTAEAVPIGRVRARASGEDGVERWEYIGRDGSLRCVRESLPVQEPHNIFAIRCGEDALWNVRLTHVGVNVRDMQNQHADAAVESVPVADEGAALEASGVQWSSHSLGLLRYAFATHQDDEPALFGALTLAAWELRAWQPDDRTPETDEPETDEETSEETDAAANQAAADQVAADQAAADQAADPRSDADATRDASAGDPLEGEAAPAIDDAEDPDAAENTPR